MLENMFYILFVLNTVNYDIYTNTEISYIRRHFYVLKTTCYIITGLIITKFAPWQKTNKEKHFTVN